MQDRCSAVGRRRRPLGELRIDRDVPRATPSWIGSSSATRRATAVKDGALVGTGPTTSRRGIREADA